ncbi:MAG: glycosyltransferase family 4 protein [bacterium]|nr:glycosyltransferase family 4 protein [bacterium]
MLDKSASPHSHNLKKICLLGMEAWGGMAQIPYTILKALELSDEQIDIYFITLRSQETENIYHPSRFSSDRIRVFFLPYETDLGKKFRRLLFYVYNPLYHFQVARLIKKINPHLIHYSTGSIIEVMTAAFFNQDIKAKMITIHDPRPHDEANQPWLKRINNLIYFLIRKLCLRRIPYFHVNASSHIAEAKTTFNLCPSRIFATHMISNVIEVPSEQKIWPAELDSLKSDLVKILFFGRIRSYKGIEYLIGALGRLFQVGFHDRIQLIIAGEGRLYCDYSAIRDRVVLINRYIENSEIGPIFTASDFVVLPYTAATQTGIVSLAYFYAKPVIGTRVGGIPELIVDGKTGFLIRAKDIHALEEKIRYLVENPQKVKEMGKAAKEYYHAHYSFESLGRELSKIYFHIISLASPGRKKV